MKALKYIVLVLLSVSVLLLLANTWHDLSGTTYSIPPAGKLNEMYEPALIRLNSLEKTEAYLDSLYNKEKQGVTFDTVLYVQLCRQTVQKRFYHELSEYTWQNNWPAWLGGTLVWSHLKAVVHPDDILKYSHAMCSQQQIVFLNLLSRKKIPFRTVGLGYAEGPGHFISEVFYDHAWHLYDVNMEPAWEKEGIDRTSFDQLKKNPGFFYRLYANKLSKEKADRLMSRVVYGEPNVLPAGKMQFMHRICWMLIILVPVFLLFLFIKL